MQVTPRPKGYLGGWGGGLVGRLLSCRPRCSILAIVGFGIVVNLVFAGLVGIIISEFSPPGNNGGEAGTKGNNNYHEAPSFHHALIGTEQRLNNDYNNINIAARPTLPPRNSSVDTAGFIHIGKTGGSTITTMLRNGCNSFASGPCRNVTNESAISKLVEHYYHVPDFWRLPTSNHKVFLLSVRDAFDRTVSALLYQHPDNARAYNLRLSRKEAYLGPMAYQCFPTLEKFADLFQTTGNSTNCNYPYRFNQVVATDCVGLACAALHGKVRFFSHLYFNYRNILETKIPTVPPREIYVIRQEHFWDDWIKANRMLGQEEPVFVPSSSTFHSGSGGEDPQGGATPSIQRNITGVRVPVTRDISSQGQIRLCKALESEYAAYFKVLRMAVNLEEKDIQECVQKSRNNCPNLDIVSMAVSITA